MREKEREREEEEGEGEMAESTLWAEGAGAGRKHAVRPGWGGGAGGEYQLLLRGCHCLNRARNRL